MGRFCLKEFRGGGRRVDWLLGWMFALFVAGIGLIIAQAINTYDGRQNNYSLEIQTNCVQ